jgi:hypothetical protein
MNETYSVCRSGPYPNVGRIAANLVRPERLPEQYDRTRVRDFFAKGKQKAIPDLEPASCCSPERPADLLYDFGL